MGRKGMASNFQRAPGDGPAFRGRSRTAMLEDRRISQQLACQFIGPEYLDTVGSQRNPSAHGSVLSASGYRSCDRGCRAIGRLSFSHHARKGGWFRRAIRSGVVRLHPVADLRWIRCLAPGGVFVFNTIHNILPDVPPENIEAMFAGLDEFGGRDA